MSRSRWLQAVVPALTALAVTTLPGCQSTAIKPAGSGRPAAPPAGSPGPHGSAAAAGPAATSRPGAASGPASASGPAAASRQAAIPPERHIVVVVMENHSYSEIIGNPQARFINRLARTGALFTASHAIGHPSEPNYLALFSGSTHGVTSDQCPTSFRAANLGSELAAADRSFTGYAEGLPAPGSLVCAQGEYARKHVPWADFRNVPRSASQPFSRFPARNFARLPAVSFVIPNLCNDMHDCSVRTGDAWLREHIARYARWAMRHASLLILTWDEDDGSQSNQIATIFVGQRVAPGRYRQRITHYSVLRAIEQACRLRLTGLAATAPPIGPIWRST